MNEKKRPGRFTVQFNLSDPQQACTVEILEQQGRQKARFISTAVLHYINCKKTPEVSLPPTIGAKEIERIVLSVLQKYTGETAVPPSPPQIAPDTKIVPSTEASGEELPPTGEDLRALLGDDGFSAIANTLASFRQK